MGRRSRERGEHPWASKPELLIYGISTIADIWHKMVWDIGRFEDLVFTKPVDVVSIPFAYPNVCLSALALRDWLRVEAKNRARAAGGSWSDEDTADLVRTKIRWANLAEDVANTFKHRGYRSTAFHNGVADLHVSLPKDLERQRARLNEFDAAMFALEHQGVATWTLVFREAESGQEIDALDVFWAWEKDWYALLSELDMLDV